MLRCAGGAFTCSLTQVQVLDPRTLLQDGGQGRGVEVSCTEQVQVLQPGAHPLVRSHAGPPGKAG